MNVVGLDHLVLCVADVARTLRFYESLLGMEPREERPGKWALHFGCQKLSLQDVEGLPEIARGTVPGSGNFCLIAANPIDELVDRLESSGIEILAGPDERIGAVGAIRSVYFRDPDGNLVEVSNPL
jgi:catechol 2,3-dioxygenase-like lactoylglutathione lyase family enzyme